MDTLNIGMGDFFGECTKPEMIYKIGKIFFSVPAHPCCKLKLKSSLILAKIITWKDNDQEFYFAEYGTRMNHASAASSISDSRRPTDNAVKILPL